MHNHGAVAARDVMMADAIGDSGLALVDIWETVSGHYHKKGLEPGKTSPTGEHEAKLFTIAQRLVLGFRKVR